MTQYQLTRHRTYITPENTPHAATLLGTGIAPEPTATNDTLLTFYNDLIEPTLPWLNPLIHTELAHNPNTLTSLAHSTHGSTLDYITIADLTTKTQGEFVTFTSGAHHTAPSGGHLNLTNSGIYTSMHCLAAYHYHGDTELTAQEFLAPLIEDYDGDTIDWDQLVHSPAATIIQSPDTVTADDIYLELPIGHPLWALLSDTDPQSTDNIHCSCIMLETK